MNNPNILFPTNSTIIPSSVCSNTPFLPDYSNVIVSSLSKSPQTNITLSDGSSLSPYDWFLFTPTEDCFFNFCAQFNSVSWIQIGYCLPNETIYKQTIYYSSTQKAGNCLPLFFGQKDITYISLVNKTSVSDFKVNQYSFIKSSFSIDPVCSLLSGKYQYNSPLLDLKNKTNLNYLSESAFSSKPYSVYYYMPFSGMIQICIQAGSNNTLSNWGVVQIIRDSITYNIESIKPTNGYNYISCYAQEGDKVCYYYNVYDGSVLSCVAFPFLKDDIILK